MVTSTYNLTNYCTPELPSLIPAQYPDADVLFILHCKATECHSKTIHRCVIFLYMTALVVAAAVSPTEHMAHCTPRCHCHCVFLVLTLTA